MTQPVFRFAPSPNGRLHLGHAYSALLNAEFAQRWGGRVLIRIEDIDLTRCRPEFESAIYEDLAWLGLAWETPVRRQSEHFAAYRAAFQTLQARGVVYPCFCSRSDIAATVRGGARPSDPDGAPLYPGTCRVLPAGVATGRIAAGDAHAWRLKMDIASSGAQRPLGYRRFDRQGAEDFVAADAPRWGDAVVVRKEIPTSYHLSVVVDDAVQGISHVVRGRDLEASTDVHVVLQRLLEVETPRYHHHDLVRDAAGDKLSKSLLSRPLGELRAEGATAAEVRRRLGLQA